MRLSFPVVADKAIQMVAHASQQVTDSRLKAMLGEVEPNLREHKKIAQNPLFEDRQRRGRSVVAVAQGEPLSRAFTRQAAEHPGPRCRAGSGRCA
jgi:hypothetical protein